MNQEDNRILNPALPQRRISGIVIYKNFKDKNGEQNITSPEKPTQILTSENLMYQSFDKLIPNAN